MKNFFQNLPYNKDLYFKCWVGVITSLVLIFAISIAFFEYNLTNADIPGGLIASFVAAYLVHLLVGYDKFMEEEGEE